jgi:chitodextrinase
MVARGASRGSEARRAGVAAEPVRPNESARVALKEAYGKLPMSFEVNRGQADARVKFLARGNGYNFFLTSAGAVLTLGRPSGDVSRAGKVAPARAAGRRPAVLRMEMEGANPSAQVTGVDELEGRSNYFVGADPRAWHTDVPNYAGVRYGDIYPGIDLVYYGNQSQLEYDFVVAPGADPSSVAIRFGGASKVRVDGDGSLVLRTPAGEVRQRRPFIYQEVNGERREVAGGYFVKGRGEVGFRVGAYDAGAPLTIDPVLVYSTYLGGGDTEDGDSIAVDSQGNAYVTGLTLSTDFPVVNPKQSTLNGSRSDVFVSKLNASGTALVYSTYLGGGVGDLGHGIDVDYAGNAYVTGTTGGSISTNDFPVVNAFQPTYGGTDDVFLTKLNPSGNALVYSTYLGGGDTDSANELTVNRTTGEAYLVGLTLSTNFPTTPGAFQTALNSTSDAFVTRFSADGRSLVYSTFLGGNASDVAHDIALDADGNAYVTGQTDSSFFPVTPGAFQTTCTGCNVFRYDAFVTKLNPQGSALVYSTFLGGSIDDFGYGIAVDNGGQAYVTGQTESGSTSTKPFPTTPGVVQPTSAGTPDAFVAKLNHYGTELVYSTFLGGSVSDQGLSIAVDIAQDAYVTGSTQSGNFPTANPIQPNVGGSGSPDAFVTKLNQTATAFVYSTYLGGTSKDEGRSIVVDSSGNAYVTGQTFSADFPTTPGAFQTVINRGVSAAPGDAFVTKIAATSNSTPTVSMTGPPEGSSYTVPASVTLSADASDSDGTITAVDFYAATSLNGTPTNEWIGEVNSAPYTIEFTNGATGDYTITAVAWDDDGASATSAPVHITFVAPTPTPTPTPANKPPVSNPGGPYSGKQGTAVVFDGANSSDPDGAIASYSWDFGDGTTGTGATPSKIYSKTGTFTVRLSVTDDKGATASATTTASITFPAPAAPTNLTATALDSSRIRLTWKDNSVIETGVKIERSTSATAGFTQIATVGANVTTFTDTGRANQTTYYYRVRAYGSAGDSAYSNVASATTPFPAPAAPTNLAAAALDASRISLTWQDNSVIETGVKIERSTSATSGFVQIATVGKNATTFTDAGRASKTTYYYRVRAYGSAGDSTYSNVASATTP